MTNQHLTEQHFADLRRSGLSDRTIGRGPPPLEQLRLS